MLSFKLEVKEKILIQDFFKMRLRDIMDDDRVFKIYVDGTLYFEDVYFPIREFIHYALEWSKRPGKDFVYNTIDNEDNPLLAFYKTVEGWKMFSIWQKFGCDNVFSDGEVENFVNEIVSQVIEKE